MRNRFMLPAILLVVGCGGGSSGPALHPATGVVNLGGKPASGILIRLEPRSGGPDAPIPTAESGADGHFTVNTSGKPGAPEGVYAVTLTRLPAPGLGPRGKPAMDRLGGRFASADRPVSEVTIRPGTNELAPFDLPENVAPPLSKPNQKGSRR
jgi:hypothetical protein